MRKIPIVEVFLSIISCWWSFVLFNTTEFFRVPQQFDGLSKIGDGWGFIFLLAAFLKIYGILAHKRGIRRIGLTFSVFLYALIASGYILSGDAINTGTGVYFALAVLALYQIREVKDNGN